MLTHKYSVTALLSPAWGAFRLVSLIAVVIYIPFIVAGCIPAMDQEEMLEEDHGQLTIFLKGPERDSLDITFELTQVNVVSEDGTVSEIMKTPLTINAISLKNRQVLLGERYLPRGRYVKLQFVVHEATIKRKGQRARLALPPEGIQETYTIKIKERENTSLFLNWLADASIVDGYLFNPEFAIKGEVPELSDLLIYVTNESSNNVSVINRDLGEVVATIMVGSRPKDVAATTLIGRERVYVANSGSNTISVIDSNTHRVENQVPVRFGREPSGIAVAKVDVGQELIFVANYRSNTVSMIDAETLEEIKMINVGQGPIKVSVDPPVEILSGARFLSFEDINLLRNYRETFFNVYVANKNSNNVSILRINRTNNNCENVTNVPVEWSPVALSVDYQSGKVYVANYNSDKLSVIDIVEIINENTSGAISTISNLEKYITGIVTDASFERIYLLKENTGELLVLRPFLQDFESFQTTLSPILGTISVGVSPENLILDTEERKAYVVNRDSNTVSVINITSAMEEKVIPVGKRPYGISLFVR